jgi:hypothetical protein
MVRQAQQDLKDQSDQLDQQELLVQQVHKAQLD